MRRALLRVLVYVCPLLLWLLVCGLTATELGSYERSWNLLHWLMNTIEPGFYYSDPQVLSMYQLTQVTRKLAHVVVYGVLTVLLVRVCQGGDHRLRWRSFVVPVLVSGAVMGVEVYLRLYQSEHQRHVRPEQFLLNGIGVGGALLGSAAYFGLKALERWLLVDHLPIQKRENIP